MFCPKCGYNAENANFCPSCGAALAGMPAQEAPPAAPFEEIVLWEGKPEGVSDAVKGPLNSVRYKITNQRIIITHGLLTTTQTEIEMRNVKDVKVHQSMGEKMVKVGDITVVSSDVTDGTVVLNNIKDPISVKELIRQAFNEERQRMHIIYRDDA